MSFLSFKEGKATDLSSLNSLEKRDAQTGLKPTTYCLLGSSTTELPSSSMVGLSQGNTKGSKGRFTLQT